MDNRQAVHEEVTNSLAVSGTDQMRQKDETQVLCRSPYVEQIERLTDSVKQLSNTF